MREDVKHGDHESNRSPYQYLKDSSVRQGFKRLCCHSDVLASKRGDVLFLTLGENEGIERV
jgi:hypothetical protein